MFRFSDVNEILVSVLVNEVRVENSKQNVCYLQNFFSIKKLINSFNVLFAPMKRANQVNIQVKTALAVKDLVS